MSGGGDMARRQEALVQAGRILTSELSLPAVLQKIATLAGQVADARYAALGVLSPDGTGLEDFVTYGVTEDERRAIGHLPVGKGILGALISDARPLRLARIQDDPRSAGFPANHPPMTSFLGVPIKVRGQVYGNLYLTEKRGAEEFTAEDEEAVVTLAAQAGVAVENARLHEQLKRLAILEDRERIAKELHDGVIQSLFAVGMGLQAAENLVHDPETLRARLGSAVEDIDSVIRNLRDYIFGLGPGGVADRQLDTALRDLIDEFRRASDLAIGLEVDPEAASLLAGRASDVVQFAREAISNAVRHSKAQTVGVTLKKDGDAITLEIDDDGAGFDPQAAQAGHGLPNLRSRAALLGGELRIESTPGTGTRVAFRVPG